MTNLANKFRLTFAVSFFAMTASRTSARSVARVNCDNFDACHSRFVFNELAQLKEGPSGNLCSLWLAKRFASLTYAFEVFNGNVSRSVFSLHNELFADLVVDVSTKTRLAFRNSLEFAANILRTPAAILLLMTFTLKGLAMPMITLSHDFNFLAAMRLAFAIGRKIDDSQINAKKISSWNRRVLWQVHSYEQEPFAIFSQNQIALPFRESESLLLIAAHHKGNDYALIQSFDRYTVKPLETHQMIVKWQSGHFAKLWLDCLVSLEGLTDLSDAANRELSRQGKSFTQLGVVEFLQMKLIGGLALEGFIGKAVCSFVESGNDLAQLSGLFLIWKQLSLQGKFHCSSIADNPNLSVAVDTCFALLAQKRSNAKLLPIIEIWGFRFAELW
jgi:hypothetical protein